MAIILPDLPYAYDALEPYIDAETMTLHHDKHHATYVANANAALEKYPEIGEDLEALLADVEKIPADIRQALINNGGGHLNHALFWELLSPEKQEPTAEVAAAINEAFGSFEAFQEAFTAAATTRFGSGWAWLVSDKDGKLEIMSTKDQSSPISLGLIPILTMDVWEQDLADLVSSGVDGADLYQLNVFDGSDLNRDIASGKVPPAATTSMQGDMFEFGRTYLEARAYRRLSAAHWSANNRERSLYNILAKAGVPMFPFGSGAGGNVDGYGMMLHRALKPYEDMVSRGEKPFMALMKQSDLQPFVNQVVSQLEQGYLNINTLVAMDSRLDELNWLYKLWEKRGLVLYNGLLYKLTSAGEFWTVNITQSTLEAMEYIITGKNSFALESVAAQDTKTTSKENPNQEIRGIGQGKANISVPTDEQTEAQRKEALMTKAKEEIAKSGASGEAANRMVQAMANLSADEIEYMMERMMS